MNQCTNKHTKKIGGKKKRARTSGNAWCLSSASRLPFSQYFITSRTLPSGASVQMPYTGRTWSWGLAISFSYRLRSLSMAAVSTHSVPLRLTATVMPLASHSRNSSSPKAPLGPTLRGFRLAWGMRGRRGPAVAAAGVGVLYRGPEEACQRVHKGRPAGTDRNKPHGNIVILTGITFRVHSL